MATSSLAAECTCTTADVIRFAKSYGFDPPVSDYNDDDYDEAWDAIDYLDKQGLWRLPAGAAAGRCVIHRVPESCRTESLPVASDKERNDARLEHLKSRLQVLMGRFDVLVGHAKQVDAIDNRKTTGTNSPSGDDAAQYAAQEALEASLEDLEAGIF